MYIQYLSYDFNIIFRRQFALKNHLYNESFGSRPLDSNKSCYELSSLQCLQNIQCRFVFQIYCDYIKHRWLKRTGLHHACQYHGAQSIDWSWEIWCPKFIGVIVCFHIILTNIIICITHDWINWQKPRSTILDVQNHQQCDFKSANGIDFVLIAYS